MADNLLVAKWNVMQTNNDVTDAVEEGALQFFKDGSCLVPAELLGGTDEENPVYLFYQAFENGTVKFEPGSNIYFYQITGDALILKAMNGAEYRFAKESKKKARVAEPVAKTAKEPEPEREPEEYEWKCPNCGKINQNYVGTCGCGELKPAHAPAFNWREVHPELVKEEPAEEEPVIETEPEEAKPAKAPEPEREPEEYEWKCPKCGKINQNYVGTCGCGEPKPANAPAFNWREVHPELVPDVKAEEEPVIELVPEEVKPEKPAEPEREPEEYEWKCPKCGKINQNYVGTCGCGEPKPAHAPAFNWREVHPELVKETKVEEEPVITVEPEKKAKPEKPAEPERIPTENEWKCPKCGKINQNYVGTCGCGEGKPAAIPTQN